ncbi:MAG: hypothetical protein ACJ72J_09810 [Nitrososphaeraceae archaeon]
MMEINTIQCIRKNPINDIAVLRIAENLTGGPLKPVEFGNSSNLRVGDRQSICYWKSLWTYKIFD